MSAKQSRPDADVRVTISVHRRLKALAAKNGQKVGFLASKIIGEYLDRLDRCKARKAGR